MTAIYTYAERTLSDRGRPHAYLARERSGPNLPHQSAVLGPHELDVLGVEIATALNQRDAARAMLAVLRAVLPEIEGASPLYNNGGPPNISARNIRDAIRQAEAAGIE